MKWLKRLFAVFSGSNNRTRKEDYFSYELWIEGIPEQMEPATFIKMITGRSFNHAIKLYVDDIYGPSKLHWRFNPSNRYWSYGGRRAYNNEKEARLLCG